MLVRAASRAAALFDFALSKRLAHAAADAGGGWAAAYALSDPLRGLGRFEEADELYDALAADAETDEQRVLAARDRAANLYWGLGRAEAAEAVLRRAESQVGSASDRELLAAERGRIAFFSHRPLDALDAVSPILAAPAVRENVGFRAALTAAPALGAVGRVDEALAVVDRWRPIATKGGLALLRSGLDMAEVFALVIGGRLADASACAEAGYGRALGEGSHLALVHWSLVRGVCAHACGRVRTALRSLDESASLVREFDPTGNLSFTLAVLAQAAAQLGDTERAEAALAESEAALPQARTLFMYDLFLARAWTAAARGELRRAQEHAWEGVEWSDERGQIAYVALLLHDLTRLGGAADAAPRLETLAAKIAGPLVAAFSAHAAALAAGDAVGIEQAARAFEDCGAVLRAAEAFCDATVAYRLAGRQASAHRAHARSRLLAQACELPVTPALNRAGPADELTPREYEVASLAASGLSSKLIAERLVVSPRTVENHLQSAYRKLGVHTRVELEELLRAANEVPPAHI
jgi:DNA-binding NarL/FixJ family response regulator